MTEKIYTAGEHVRIIKADSGYNEELGAKQVGLVGTVTTGADTGGAYIKFPHYEGDLYFTSNEIEPVNPTPAPEPEKEYLFRAGDTVRYNGNNSDWKDSEFIVNDDVRKSFYFTTTVSLTMTKAPDTLERFGYKVGSTVNLSTDTIEKFTPAPEPKFKSGDWVKVTGRNDKYDGIVGQIDSKGWANFWAVTGTDGEKYSFAEDKLELTEAPYVPKFKDGDWATVPADYGDYSGKVFEVTNGDKHRSDNVALRLIDPADPYHIWTGYFPTDSLKKADKPWTPKYAVGDWVQVKSGWGDWTGNPAQVLEVPTNKQIYYTIKTTKPVGGHDGREGLFSEKTLDPSEKPFEPTYKVGDWVKVINYSGWNGTIGQVIRERGKSATDNLTKIKVHGKGNVGVFLDKELERTAEPHWTVTTPVHSAVRVGGRTVVKLEGDKWLFIYHEGKDTEKIPTVMYRSAREAKNLLSKEPEVAVPVTE